MGEKMSELFFEPGPAQSIRARFDCASCLCVHETYFLDSIEAERFANHWRKEHYEKEHGDLL